MAITAAQVKELREMTGAGMMDCKKALTACDGDFDKAIDFLREKGLAGAQKKAGRIAAEGVCDTKVSEDEKKAVVVEVNAETDFVAKNEKFRTYVAQVADQAINTEAADIDAFLAEKWNLDPSMTVADALSSTIAIIGENMHIRRFAQVSEPNGMVVSYIHANGKIGVLVDVETDVVNDDERVHRVVGVVVVGSPPSIRPPRDEEVRREEVSRGPHPLVGAGSRSLVVPVGVLA